MGSPKDRFSVVFIMYLVGGVIWNRTRRGATGVEMLVGLAMFVIGILIHTQPEFSQETLSKLLQQLEQTANSTGVSIDTSAFSVTDVAYSFTIALICFGLFLAAVSVLGLVGVKYSLKPILIVFDSTVKPHLKDTITDNYSGLDGSDAATQIWNGIMIELKCCGVDSYEDFQEADNWDKELHGYGPFAAPVACCKETPTGPTYDFSCAMAPTDATSNWKTGCYGKIWDYLISNSGIVIGIAAVVLCLQEQVIGNRPRSMTASAGVTLDTSAFSVAELAVTFSIILVVFGIFLAGVAVLGIIGAKCGLKPVLIVYFIITLVLFLTQLILVLIVYFDRDAFNETVKPRFKDTITDSYTGPGWNEWGHSNLERWSVCGVDDYNDFSSAANWDKELAGTSGLITPVACCKTISTNYACAKNPSDSNSNWKTGCYDEIWDYALVDSGIVIGIAAGVLVVQLLK
nr:hypothetical protein BaRGS_015506 [Batillaria attramentaria]